MLDISLAILVSLLSGFILKFPPALPRVLVILYDYPIFRMLILGIILGLSFIIPITCVVLGIFAGIVFEDTISSSKYPVESFESLENALKRRVEEKMKPIEDALSSVEKTQHILRD
jgi:hypothetical protein